MWYSAGHMFGSERAGWFEGAALLVPAEGDTLPGREPKYWATVNNRRFVVKQFRPTWTDVESWRKSKNFLKELEQHRLAAMQAVNLAEAVRSVGVKVPDEVGFFDDDQGIPSIAVSDVSYGGLLPVWSPQMGTVGLERFGWDQDQIARVQRQLTGACDRLLSHMGLGKTGRAWFLVDGERGMEVVYGDFGPGDGGRFWDSRVEQEVLRGEFVNMGKRLDVVSLKQQGIHDRLVGQDVCAYMNCLWQSLTEAGIVG